MSGWELVDADGDDIPDTTHTSIPGAEIVERPDAEPVPLGPAQEGELVDDDDRSSAPVTVNPTPVVVPLDVRWKTADRRPVIAPWLKSKDQAKDVAKWAAGHFGHVAAFHTVRSPLYVAKLAAWSPRGIALALWAGLCWAFDRDGVQMRQQAAKGTDPTMHLRLREERRQVIRTRLILAALVLVLVIAGLVLGLVLVAVWTWLLVSLAVLGAGWFGAPKDKPPVGRAVVIDKFQRLTDTQVEKALQSIGIAKLANSKDDPITFTAPIQRDGPGWRAEVNLPLGVTVTMVMDKREELASGLRRPLGCVWPEPASEEHPGHLVLWVGDRSMHQTKPPKWPLAKKNQIDIFNGLPFMTDQRGQEVWVNLVFDNMLIGSRPRRGKTFAMRQVVLGAALDPNVELRIHELKGTGDLQMVERIAHRYCSGAGDEALDETLASIREVAADLERRAKVISHIAKTDRTRCPENKVTPELSADKTLGLHIVLLVIDEIQNLFTSEEHRKEAEKLAEKIIKLGPAMGIIFVKATQRPDKDSLPKTISDNVGLRFALQVIGQPANDMILGTSMYKAGVRATMFTPKDLGIGYLVGAGDEPMIGRTYYIDGTEAEQIAQRAYAMRKKAGTITGYAAGEAMEPVDPFSLWRDIATVFAAADKLHSEVIVQRLAELRPEVYGDLTAQAFGQMVPTKPQVWIKDPSDGGGGNRAGLDRATVMAHLEAKSGVKQLPL